MIYLDNAATTKVNKEVLKAMLPYYSKMFGNASEPHNLGYESKIAIEKARNYVAKFIGASGENITFTGSATESINLAIKGLVEQMQKEYPNTKFHIITTPIEHKAVLETCKHLERLGWVEVEYLPVSNTGLINPEDVEKAIKENTILVSVMLVNNEVGTIEPVNAIGRKLKGVKKDIPCYFHSDVTQAVGYVPINALELNLDMMSFSGHKICAPKGLGVLFRGYNVNLVRQVDGGGQESGLRAGTENIPYIVGLRKALELIDFEDSKRVTFLRQKLINGVLKIKDVILTGDKFQRVPHIASFIINGLEGESLVLLLSNMGIMASSGSACNSNDLAPSHVLTAMGFKPEESHGSIRFSLGKETTEQEIDRVIKVLPGIVKTLRSYSPIYG